MQSQLIQNYYLDWTNMYYTQHLTLNRTVYGTYSYGPDNPQLLNNSGKSHPQVFHNQFRRWWESNPGYFGGVRVTYLLC